MPLTVMLLTVNTGGLADSLVMVKLPVMGVVPFTNALLSVQVKAWADSVPIMIKVLTSDEPKQKFVRVLLENMMSLRKDN